MLEACETSLAGCKVANNKYLDFLREEASTKLGWISVAQKRYNQAVHRIESVIASQIKVEVCVFRISRRKLLTFTLKNKDALV